MTTFSELKTVVARRLRDTSNSTFSTTDLGDFINSAISEIGRLAPSRFQEDITPVADTFSYPLNFDAFAGVEVPEIELVRVEVWDASASPQKPIMLVQPQSAQPINYSNAGWVNWGGRLEIPYRTVNFLDVDSHLIRVWGYSPYVSMVADGDVIPVSAELQDAIILWCRIEAMRALLDNRVLFKQWQTQSNNSDVSPAMLGSDLNSALEEWRRKSKAIFVLREAPG